LQLNRPRANCLMRAQRVCIDRRQNVPEGLQVCYQMVNARVHGF